MMSPLKSITDWIQGQLFGLWTAASITLVSTFGGAMVHIVADLVHLQVIFSWLFWICCGDTPPAGALLPKNGGPWRHIALTSDVDLAFDHEDTQRI